MVDTYRLATNLQAISNDRGWLLQRGEGLTTAYLFLIARYGATYRSVPTEILYMTYNMSHAADLARKLAAAWNTTLLQGKTTVKFNNTTTTFTTPGTIHNTVLGRRFDLCVVDVHESCFIDGCGDVFSHLRARGTTII